MHLISNDDSTIVFTRALTVWEKRIFFKVLRLHILFFFISHHCKTNCIRTRHPRVWQSQKFKYSVRVVDGVICSIIIIIIIILLSYHYHRQRITRTCCSSVSLLQKKYNNNNTTKTFKGFTLSLYAFNLYFTRF